MLGGASLGGMSYFKHGEADFIFKSQPYGSAIELALGLGALIGIFGAQGIVISHKNQKPEPIDRSNG